MFRFACAAAAALLLSAPSALAQDRGHAVSLTFETGATTGRVMVALYDSAAAYRGGPAVARAAIDASGPAVAVFRDLPSGDYAVKAFHDVDGDGEMDTNPFGIPVEPYAFSNNARGDMGPASWERARFTVSGDVAQTIRIR
ncbi:DUF2141 domain-containing protein [Brevundimonas viscosa]|uniref:Uncharacterized conserved protein, DUF2141 family n=1 Tax=Brevundimonas viscosa TaxID=871741 RepID=A0A1I6NU55_9CAUL|nr:DUF2141 domain-containing protein [Brevundimonas viscosa]SFS31473.1 Uncharacterized conserved protein, DUF2141 family [Brevundimonas viscosa]